MRKWSEVRRELFTPEEIRESDLRVARMIATIEGRQKKNVSQRKLMKLSRIIATDRTHMKAGRVYIKEQPENRPSCFVAHGGRRNRPEYRYRNESAGSAGKNTCRRAD